MHIHTLLNQSFRHKGFVYGRAWTDDQYQSVIIPVRPRKNSRARCGQCGTPSPVFHAYRSRRFQLPSLWDTPMYLEYTVRRVTCPQCGVHTEDIPWSVGTSGKSPLTTAMAHHLASLARLLSWKDVAHRCNATWDLVATSVLWLVTWGIKHRSLDGITSLGVDEIQYTKGHKYLTLVYQIDDHQRRLLWIGKERTKECFNTFFNFMGQSRCAAVRYVCSDMWKAYLTVIAQRVPQALNILDRFHIAKHLNEAVNQTRCDEVSALRRQGKPAYLHKSRWVWLKRRSRLKPNQKSMLRELLDINLRTVKAYLLKERFDHLWSYTSPTWAGKFITQWCRDVKRYKTLPRMRHVAQMIKQHQGLILNYFRVKKATSKTLSSGIVEGFNNKAKLCIRKSYGFRSDKYREAALFLALGDLPEPEATLRFA